MIAATPWPSSREQDTSQRILVLTPIDVDARAVCHVLTEAGCIAFVCGDLADVAAEIANEHHGAAGAVIVAQEACSGGEGHRQLAQVLATQPEWSDLPLILLASPSSDENVAWDIARGIDPVGNITILERPLRRTTLLNAVAVALRARARQYALRTTMRELAQHRERLTDLVEQRTAELAASMASLRASERLASLGTLAAGLGHDIANLTMPIRARLDALRVACPTGDFRTDLDAITVALNHLSQLSAGMRLLGLDPDRANASAPATDLTAWAAETTPMLHAALAKHIRFTCTIADGLGVAVPRHRLAQAVFNLVQNAGEAMAGQRDGEVSLTAEPGNSSMGPRSVSLRVEDNGPGMTPEVLARCFEPYFSTKGRAIATGMGLAMVKAIVEAAHGTITIQSAPGQGATFTLTLPAARMPSDQQPSAPGQTGAVTLTNPRIANLACALLDRFQFKPLKHQEPGIPASMLWILEAGDLARAAEFLQLDVRRRAIVLTNQRTSASELSADLSSRLTILPDVPTPSALRNALDSARAACRVPV
jgi:signal transduction histidine kinase